MNRVPLNHTDEWIFLFGFFFVYEIHCKYLPLTARFILDVGHNRKVETHLECKLDCINVKLGAKFRQKF